MARLVAGTTAGGGRRDGGDPADAAERFMRRLLGDERWDHLPPGTRTRGGPRARRWSAN